ncbi:hypothetical protein NDU88_001134 [Pleurodeles waltl]|uniref:Uncharacterized protein n=1 Tax=Pleurodeles waltl TaxID=8319 RepID=A0AAV7UTU4_PLEWA|nr:hypothetical protein NDU88_001134 [Pleurodeles waltl]
MADIRRALLALSLAPLSGTAGHFQSNASSSLVAVLAQDPQVLPMIPMIPAQLSASSQGQSTSSHDVTAQALPSVAQLLSKLDVPQTPVPPTMSWAPSDAMKNAIDDLRRHVDSISAMHFSGTADPCNKSLGDILSSGGRTPKDGF